MHPKPIATTLLLYAVGTLGVSFVAYSDNFCQKPITMRANDSEVVNELSIDRSITDDFHAYGRYYDGVTFEGTEPVSSTGTMRKVYWKMRDPETISENIRTIGQQFAMTKPAPCGSVVAQAAHVPSLLVSRSRSKLHFPNHPSL